MNIHENEFKPMNTLLPKANTLLGDIILVDDNLRLSHELSLVLQAADWTVRCADDGESLRAQMAQKVPAIVVLDLNLPGEDGISLCQWLRKTYPQIGIVMLTARVMGIDRTRGYVAGADIYLTKPTRSEELLAVIGNLWRRSQLTASVAGSLQELPWTLHLKALRLLSPQTDMLSLTPTECALLQKLASANDVCTYAQLSDVMGSDGLNDILEKARMEVVVSRLRKKLASFSGQSFQIKTSHGQGYKLTSPLAVKAS
jgi:DNA-binding response OmpR family regulator